MVVEENAYDTHQWGAGAGDIVVLYTDGMIERRGESLDIGLARLSDAVRGGPEDAQRMCDNILERLLEPAGQRYDDVTAVVARLLG
jgi:serine phosphatase RsbU (regulator of sigma subunit)